MPPGHPPAHFCKKKRNYGTRESLFADPGNMAMDLALARAREDLESAVEERSVTTALHEMMCKSHPKAMVSMLETATKRVAELQQELEGLRTQINAHIAIEEELKKAKIAERDKWMGVVQRKNAELLDVSPAYSRPSRKASIHTYAQMHEVISEFNRQCTVYKHRVTNCDSLLNQSFNWTLKQVQGLTSARHTP